MTPDQPQRAPAASAERIVSLDFIRGIAVLGILFANIVAFGQPEIAYLWPPALGAGATRLDETFWLFQFVFIDEKFRVLFVLLFGAGLYLFTERAWARGDGRGLQARRLLILLLFGLMHYFLIWIGDILSLYAVWGLVALSTMKWKAKTQLRVGIAIIVIKSLGMTALATMSYTAANVSAAAETTSAAARAQIAQVETEALAEARKETVVYQGSYAAILADRLSEAGKFLRAGLLTGGAETFCLVLIGMALYRLGLFSGAVEATRLRRWGWSLLIPGLLLAAVAGYWPWATGFGLTKTILVFSSLGKLPHLLTAFGLLFLLVVWAPNAAQTPLGQRFAAAGRMAFSNYLGTSLLMMPIFHGWGLGLYGELNRIELFGVVLCVWALMLGWSKPWLARFRYGPLEWLWRCLTYGKRFPFRRAEAD
ncbi:MAG: DUF418 domain-containing protein [Sphingomonas sp.]|uniref:DUF418 domain-containing protein n=1 Tax=Sphingomonas sp. TaxID=28214 RepID=UPI0025D9F606|nr:DUF418 domain-containing protein [Sphingomonas sp.]MBY0282668.1 DUF418 domain-containing protein [Sphingomonas sp.]